MKKLFFAASFLIFSTAAYTQLAVGIGTATPNASAMLDVTSSNKGFLAPRMNSSTRTGIPSPAAGLLIFDTTTGSYWYYSGSTWVNLAASGGSSPWSVNGNYIYHLTDSLGLGTSSPDEKLHISNGQMRLSRTASFENKIIFSMPATNGITSETQGLKFQLSSVDKAFIGYSSTAFSGSYLRLSGNGVNASDLVISSTGKIGIGTSQPSEKLDVAGNINMNATNPTLQLQNAGVDKGFVQLSGDDLRMGTNTSNDNGKFIVRVNGLENFAVTGTGNVGVGTISPATKLHIAGNTRMVNTGEVLRIDGSTPTINFYNNGSFKSFLQHSTSGLYMGVNSGNIQLDAVQIAIGQVVSGASAYKLSVTGKIICEEVRVKLVSSGWPDYVFAGDYKLPPLREVEQFIKSNKHLSNIPSASEVEKNGIEIGDMQKRMMEKIEELTLYVIDLQKQIEAFKKNQ